MASKLITLEDAAKQLGVSTGELNEMRQRQELYGYRDGSSWKFKSDDVERLCRSRADAGMGGPAAPEEEVPEIDLGDVDDDVVLLDELALGQSGPNPSSTVIGKPDQHGQAAQSDIKLQESARDSEGSDLRLVQSDVKLADSGELVLSGSNIGSDEEKTMLTTAIPGSTGDSSIKLTDDEDVLGGPGSGSGSDITANPSDSGILLVDPRDSGLSLETPPELGGKDELTQQTTDFESDPMLELKEDDDFLLTPFEEEEGGEESDSGSQVIALDTDEGEYDEATATLLTGQVPGFGEALQAHDAEAEEVGVVPLSEGRALAAGAAGGAVVYREHPYSALDVVGLALCVLALAFTGMMMYDLVRNMWSWDSPYEVNSFFMDMILGRG